MKITSGFHPAALRLLAARLSGLCLALLFASTAGAQVPATDPITLAKYDANKNGRLDPEEVVAMEAAQRTPAIAAASGPGSATVKEEAILMTPFEVVDQNKGYYSPNTMSGTRLNSKLEDLGAAISVVTKEQMADFALLDMNDIFNYEASTEGTGNYTDFAFNRNFEPESMTQLQPEIANRIRGVGNANTTLGNFETSGRVPIDPIAIDSVEISRGPNSSIFGIGSVAGNVNAVPSAANLTRNFNRFSTRVDSFEGYRLSTDLNRVLMRGQLAVRGSAVYQHEAFDLKPSGLDSVRLNGMFRFKPFAKTMISASYTNYKMHGNRPNVTPPREVISGWRNEGMPTWDPVTHSVKKNGVVVAANLTSLPAYLRVSPPNAMMQMFIDERGLSYLSAPNGTSATNPNVADFGANAGAASIANLNARRLVSMVYDPTGIRNVQPLYAKVPVATDKSIYDWSEVNIAAANKLYDTAEISSVTFDQMIFDTRRNMLALQAGFYRENTERYDRNAVGVTSNVSTIQGLELDINERLLDGSPNPYFLRPYYGAMTPIHREMTQDRDIYRLQAAYKLDLRKETSLLKWLGMHTVTGYSEYKEIINKNRQYYYAITSDHPWILPSTSRAGRGGRVGGNLNAGTNILLGYMRHYVGDNVGANVDGGSYNFDEGDYDFRWGNAVDGFKTERVHIGTAPFSAGGGNNFRTILRSEGVIVQSHLLKDRVVTTFGFRNDARYGKGGVGLTLKPDGSTIDMTRYDEWSTADWQYGAGPTRTAGIVVKPTRWLSLFANKSDSFQPASINSDLYLNLIGDPTGKGEDYGFALSLFKDKLYIKVNQYKTLNLDKRGGQVQSFAVRARNIDFNPSIYAGYLQGKAEEWVTAAAVAQGVTLTPAQKDQRVMDIMKMPRGDLEYLQPLKYGTNAVEDVVGEGTEIEVHFNPTNYWTVKANVTKSESRFENMSPEVNAYIAEREKAWESIIDPILNVPWFTHRYVPNQSPKEYHDTFVKSPLKLAQALAGKSLPQIRKYRANMSTSFRLAGITEHKYLKRFTVGGAVRWEDKGAIGFRGVQSLPAIVTDYDADRPIWDKGNLNVDAFFSYRTRLFNDRVGASFQLNVRSLTESGRLQPIAMDPDGTPSSYRIVPPRQFILQASFDL
jgi:outer membrane receptor protein involved in Fe transport